MLSQDYHWQLIPLAINAQPRLPLATYTTGSQWSAKSNTATYTTGSQWSVRLTHWQLIPLAVNGRPRLPLESYTTDSQWSAKTTTGNLYHCKPMSSKLYHCQPIPLKRKCQPSLPLATTFRFFTKQHVVLHQRKPFKNENKAKQRKDSRAISNCE